MPSRSEVKRLPLKLAFRPPRHFCTTPALTWDCTWREPFPPSGVNVRPGTRPARREGVHVALIHAHAVAAREIAAAVPAARNVLIGMSASCLHADDTPGVAAVGNRPVPASGAAREVLREACAVFLSMGGAKEPAVCIRTVSVPDVPLVRGGRMLMPLPPGSTFFAVMLESPPLIVRELTPV